MRFVLPYCDTPSANPKLVIDFAVDGWFLLQELQRLQKLMQLPSIPEALKEKFGKFDENLNPTHDHEGKELDSKVCCAREALHHLLAYLPQQQTGPLLL